MKILGLDELLSPLLPVGSPSRGGVSTIFVQCTFVAFHGIMNNLTVDSSVPKPCYKLIEGTKDPRGLGIDECRRSVASSISPGFPKGIESKRSKFDFGASLSLSCLALLYMKIAAVSPVSRRLRIVWAEIGQTQSFEH